MRYLPLSPMASTELVPLFRRMLELCRVNPREKVLVYSDTQARPNYVAAFVGAALELGADTANMTVPSVDPASQPFAEYTQDAAESLTVKAWQAADMVIDLRPGVGQGYSQAIELACPTGTRILRVAEPVEVLERTFPSEKDKARVLASKEVLKKGRFLRMVSEAGTDLTMDKTGRGVAINYGYSDEPGHWDYWAACHVCASPLEDSAEGVLVINVGDAIVPLVRYISDPIRFIIEGGRIVEIEGDGVDAFLLRDWFERWKDSNAYVVSHIGWGLQDKANWNRMHQLFMEAGGLSDCESYWGDVQIAFGHSAGYMLRGKNVSRAHIDIDCRNCSFYVDDQLIVDKGEIAPQELVEPNMEILS